MNARRTTAIAPPPSVPVGEQGQFAGSAPTTAQELMRAWELSQESWNTERVKVFRHVMGTRTEQLVHECPLPEWSLERIAGRLGPGTYRMAPGPGPNRSKSATVHVGPEYAQDCGWGEAPPEAPRASELVARRTMEQAVHGPTDPLALAQMIETIMERRERDLMQRIQPQNQGMDAMTLMLKGFEMSNMMMSKSMEAAKSLVGVGGEEKGPATIADVLMQLGPDILKTLQAVVTAPRPMPQAQPGPRPMPQAQPGPRPMPQALPEPKPEPEPQEVEMSQETRDAVLKLTQEEQDAIAPAIGLFKPYVGKLTPMLGKFPASLLAGNIAGYIGPDFVDATIALKIISERDRSILGVIAPELDSEEGLKLVQELADKLNEMYPNAQE